jgi:signal transduction histidine kinase
MGTTSPLSAIKRPTAGSAEHVWYRDYERQRRLRLTRVLLPMSAIIEFLLFAFSTLLILGAPYTSPTREIAFAVDAIEGLCVLAFCGGLIFVRRGHAGRAVASVIVPASVTILLPVLAYDLADLLQPGPLMDSIVNSLTQLATLATLALIVLVSVLTASRWMTLAITLLINLFTVLISYYGSGAFGGPRGTLSPFVEFAILTQWTVGGILAATAGSQRATLRELETTRIAYERSKQVEELKDQLITHINHEVRSPVMAVQGYLDLLQATAARATPEQRDTYITRAKRAADGLARLVTSVLSMRSLEREASPVELQAVDLRAAVAAAAEAIDPHEAQPGERELRVSIPAELAVWGDPVRVQQILTNLLSNAVKYSAPDTSVEVAARVVESSEQGGHSARPRVDITVRDHGHGIPPEQIPLLFERFVRLPRDLASSVPGNGLGLYLSRTFAEAMGGSIWVESTGVEGEGATFHLELPDAAVPAQQAAPADERHVPEPLLR